MAGGLFGAEKGRYVNSWTETKRKQINSCRGNRSGMGFGLPFLDRCGILHIHAFSGGRFDCTLLFSRPADIIQIRPMEQIVSWESLRKGELAGEK